MPKLSEQVFFSGNTNSYSSKLSDLLLFNWATGVYHTSETCKETSNFTHTGAKFASDCQLHVVAMFAIQIRICFLCQCTSHTATYQHWSLFGEEGEPCRWLQTHVAGYRLMLLATEKISVKECFAMKAQWQCFHGNRCFYSCNCSSPLLYHQTAAKLTSLRKTVISPWCLNFSGAGFNFIASLQVTLKVSILEGEVVGLRQEQLHSWDELRTMEISAVNFSPQQTHTNLCCSLILYYAVVNHYTSSKNNKALHQMPNIPAPTLPIVSRS